MKEWTAAGMVESDLRPRRDYQLHPDEARWLVKELRRARLDNEWIRAAEYFPLQTRTVKAALYGMFIAFQLRNDEN